MPKFSEFCVCNNLQGIGLDGTLVLESRRVTLEEAKAKEGWIFGQVGFLYKKGIEEVQDLLLDLAYGESDSDTVYLSNDWTVHGCVCSNPGASCVGCPCHWASASADDEDAGSDADYRHEFEERTGIDFAWVLGRTAHEGTELSSDFVWEFGREVPEGADLSGLGREIEKVKIDRVYPATIESQFLDMPKGTLLTDALRKADRLYSRGTQPEKRPDSLSIWLEAQGMVIPF